MRLFSLIGGCIAILLIAAPAAGAEILFSDPGKDAAQGIHVQPTGPDDPPVLGLEEVLGVSDAFYKNTTMERFYSGVATFDQPATSVTFDVQRLNDSGWRNPITIIGLDDHKRVASTTVNLAPLGETSHITITAPAINQIEWSGADWTFHPYTVKDINVTFESDAIGAVDPSRNTPSVGSPVPEPGSGAILGLAGAGALLRRRRATLCA